MALFDPDDLVRLAGRIETQASELRAKGRSLVAAAGQARWHSTAATAFRAEIDRLDHRFRHAAHNLERAADELRAHAHRVRTAEAALAAVARLEQAGVREAGRLGRAGVREGEHVVGAGIHGAEHAAGWLGRHL